MVSANRISDFPVVPALKSKAKGKAKAKSGKAKATPSQSLWFWGLVGVILLGVLSATLNGYANWRLASVPAIGSLLGILVPVIVLVFGKVAGGFVKKKMVVPATLTGLVGGGLLFLSVTHCAHSIALLTGMDSMSAMLMSIAIDCGVVLCEWAMIMA